MRKKVLLGLLHDLTLKLFVIGCVSSLFFSLLGLFGTVHRYAELASHFRVQYLWLSILSVIGFALFRARRWLAISVISVLLNAAFVVPMLSLTNAERSANGAHNFRILLSNVLYRNRNYEAVKELVKSENPDVIILQEAIIPGSKR